MPNNTSANRGYLLPHADNRLRTDVGRIISALQAVDVDVHQLRTLLGITGNPDQVDLAGAPTADTPQTSESSRRLATTAYVKALISELIDSSPESLDTFREFAEALGNDPNFATTVLDAITHQKSIFHGLQVVDGRLIYTRSTDNVAVADYAQHAIASGGLTLNVDDRGHLIVMEN